MRGEKVLIDFTRFSNGISITRMEEVDSKEYPALETKSVSTFSVIEGITRNFSPNDTVYIKAFGGERDKEAKELGEILSNHVLEVHFI